MNARPESMRWAAAANVFPHRRERTRMLIRVGHDIMFEHPAPTPIIAMLYLHPSRGPSIRWGDHLLGGAGPWLGT